MLLPSPLDRATQVVLRAGEVLYLPKYVNVH
jgi:hypothetical protein